MSDRDATIRKLRAAARRRAKATAEVERLVTEAYAAHTPIRTIAEAAGFRTRKAVYDLLRRRGK